MSIRSTTILAVRRDGKLAIAGDGQVTLDKTDREARRAQGAQVRGGKVIAGFAGSARRRHHAAREVRRQVLREYKDLTRAAVELAKDWRQDRALRRLEALMIVGNPEHLFVLSGTGDVIEPDEGIAAIGSGGPYAQAAGDGAAAQHRRSAAEEIARKGLEIASEICIYTNDDITVETLP